MSFIREVKRGDNIYLAEVRNKRVGKKVVQEHIRYIGKKADGKTILSCSIFFERTDLNMLLDLDGLTLSMM